MERITMSNKRLQLQKRMEDEKAICLERHELDFGNKHKQELDLHYGPCHRQSHGQPGVEIPKWSTKRLVETFLLC